MDPRQKSRFEISLIQDLDCFSGDFERFGYCFIDKYQPAAWDHRGTTTGGAPVKVVIDSVAKGGALTAEYSADKNYFSDDAQKKIRKDLDHILSTYPRAKRIWLLSSRLATGGEMTEVQKALSNDYLPKYPGLEIEVLDSRRIAEFIVKNLTDHSFIENLIPFLPFLSQLRDEWALSHHVPAVQGYVYRPLDEHIVINALRTHRLAIVSGFSGIGKSALCSAVATQLKGEYELILWQDASDLSDAEQLRAVDAYGNGERANLLGYLKTRKCLLILDNINSDDIPRKVLDKSGPDCHILATSQISIEGPNVIKLGPVDETIARQILTAGIPSGCPPQAFTTIWRAIGGHPLLLSILNDLVIEQGTDWTLAVSFAEDALNLEDDRRERVCIRILKQHEKTLQVELQFIAWASTANIDAVLLSELCGKTSEYALSRRHFLAGLAPGTVRVHDLVFRSIRAMVVPIEARSKQFTAKLAEFVVKRLDEIKRDRLRLARVARMHHRLFAVCLTQSSLRNVERAAFRYAYALARAPSSDLALLGDPVSEATRLSSSDPKSISEIEIRAVVESIEAGYTLTKQQQSKDAAIARHKSILPAFEHLKQLKTSHSDLMRDVLLHEAKAFLRSGETGRAEAMLRSLVQNHPDYSAARMHLGRMFAERSKGKLGAELIDALAQFTAVIDLDPQTVPITILLASFEFLMQLDRGEALAAIQKHKARLLAGLQEASEIGLDQPFQVVAKLGSTLWYNAPELMDELYSVLPARSAAFDDEWSLFDWAQVQKYVAKARLDRGVGPNILRPLLLNALAAYEQLSKRDQPQTVQYAECLTLAARPLDARAALKAIVAGSGQSVHWYHRYAQASRACGDLREALSAINHAIANNNDSKYAAAFLHERWLIRQAENDEFAIDDLDRAIAACTAGRFWDQLQRERSSYPQSPPAA